MSLLHIYVEIDLTFLRYNFVWNLALACISLYRVNIISCVCSGPGF